MDSDETLEFGDAARVYLSEYPIFSWEIEGAFNLAAQFVHDWALGHVQVVDGMSYQINRAVPRAAFGPTPVATEAILEPQLASAESDTSELKNEDWIRHATLETEDPLSGTMLRMIFGEHDGAPMLALFVGEDEEPILIDRSALQIAIDEGCRTTTDVSEPPLSFKSNAEHQLEVIDLDINVGPGFE